MNERLQAALAAEFPTVFKNLGGDMRETCMAWGCDVGDGWFSIIWNLCTKLEPLGAVAAQVKEKFGGLRFYLEPYDCPDDTDGAKWRACCEAVSQAERAAYSTCEDCGAPGHQDHGRGWIKTLCDACGTPTMYRLCYVEGSWAWFTTQDVTKQWGDDWNDAPYEHNAGTPYDYREHNRERGDEFWALKRLAFFGPFDDPAERSNSCNSPYSVEMINAGETPWLAYDRYTKERPEDPAIYAGATVAEFCEWVKKHGGEVYTRG